jgi:uncharacterized protein YecE (DUF72 family)
MPVLIGTSGWQYRHWRELFYPIGVPQRNWLEHYAGRFDTVESNNAFYRLPERATFESWAQRTPPGFVWAVKMSRYLTHIKRLADPSEPVQRFLERAKGLGPKLGPVLLQLPPTLKADLARLDEVLLLLTPHVRVAVEFRHNSWFTAETRALLEQRGAALCLADRGSKPVTPLWRTAPWGYVRWHQGRAAPEPCYGEGALRSWAARVAELWSGEEDVFCFFNNDPLGCALRDARLFAGHVRRTGREPTRVPEAPVRAIKDR